MAQISAQLSTGLPGLDRVLKGLIPGDNVVWQVSSVNDYRPFVRPCCENALARGQPLIYFRFAKHEPLVSTDLGATVYPLQPEAGFEAFITDIHKVIAKTGRGGGSHLGEMRISLVPQSKRTRSSEQIAADLRKRLRGIPGVTIRTRAGQGLFVLRIGTYSFSDHFLCSWPGAPPLPNARRARRLPTSRAGRRLDSRPGGDRIRLSNRFAERWLSGRKRRFAKPLSGLKPAPRVRIPASPPNFA